MNATEHAPAAKPPSTRPTHCAVSMGGCGQTKPADVFGRRRLCDVCCIRLAREYDVPEGDGIRIHSVNLPAVLNYYFRALPEAAAVLTAKEKARSCWLAAGGVLHNASPREIRAAQLVKEKNVTIGAYKLGGHL